MSFDATRRQAALLAIWASLGFLPAGRTATLSLDPAAPLTNSWPAGEWNSEGDSQGWTLSQIDNVAVSGGLLSGVAGGADPQLSLRNITGGPDLDLGTNDYLEIRLQLPVGYPGDLQIFWGTTNLPGISTGRVVTVASTHLAQDGAFHVYRLDMSLEPAWQGCLTDLRLDPLGGSGAVGQSFALDYVRVGDVGPAYQPNYLFYPQGAANVYDALSKHFRVVWGPSNATWQATAQASARGNLRNMEDQFALYTKVLGYREPCESTDPAKRTGTRYKVNLVVGNTGLSQHLGGGYFMGYDGATGFGYLIIDPSGLRVDPPSWVNPHEGGHVFQVHQGGGYVNNNAMGFWWEAHANWFREQYLKHPLYPGSPTSGFGSAFPNNAHFYHGHGRHYYDHWPLFEYLEENPDHLPGLGAGFTARLWQESLPGEYIYATIARLAPGTSIQDVLGYYVRRNVTWDYRNQAAIWRSLGIDRSLHYAASYVRRAHTELRQRADDPTWWEVPPEMAPMQGAYNLVELTPTATNVSVNFRALPALGRTTGFRVCLVAVNTNGIARYGPLGAGGLQSMTLAGNETKLFLTVAATPDDFMPQEADEARFPYHSHPARMRFLYEAQFAGAVPKASPPWLGLGAVTGAPHPNGGGFVASTASVDPTAYVGPNAKVLDTAQVRGQARVEDFAVVQNAAQVRDRAVVSGYARVRDSARVLDHGKVRDYGEVRDSARVVDHGRVFEHGTVAETLVVTNQGNVKGFAYAWDAPDGMMVRGSGALDGDYAAGNACSNSVNYGWLSSSNYAAGRAGTMPDGLCVSYEFDRGHPSVAEDKFGVTWAGLRGAPTWLASEAGRPGVLRLNGSTDYLALPRSASDHDDLTLAAWVRWDGGAAGQRLWEFAGAADRFLYLTPNDGVEGLRVCARLGATEERLTAPALATGGWHHVAFTLAATTATLFVDGRSVATGRMTLKPDQLLAPNTLATPQANYVGRGQGGHYFQGALDEVRVYARALNAAEVASLSVAPPTTLVATGSVWRYHDLAQNLGTAWRSNSFSDATWSSGPAQLGFGDGDEATVIGDRDQITTYFRRTFAVADPAAIGALQVRVLRDDGAVVFLNGAEVFRSNLPLPPTNITYTTLALGSVPAADETTTFHATTVSPALLRAGENLLAVEVHQNSAASSDVSFDLELIATGRAPLVIALSAPADGSTHATDQLTLAAATVPGVTQVVFYANSQPVGTASSAPFALTWTGVAPGVYGLTARAFDHAGASVLSDPVQVTVIPPPLVLVGAGSVWRYHDLGTNLGTAWRLPAYDDRAWAAGAAQLGFGDNDEATVVSNRQQLTFYFRHAFELAAPGLVTNLVLRLLRDDGAAVYLNGVEVWRSNLPTAGAISFTTPASSTLGVPEENTWYVTNASPTLLVAGTNLVAVEVHNGSTGSSDLSFDFALIAERGWRAPTSPTLRIVRGPGSVTLTWPNTGVFNLYASPGVSPPSWSLISPGATLSGDTWSLTLPAPGTRFFRLQAP